MIVHLQRWSRCLLQEIWEQQWKDGNGIQENGWGKNMLHIYKFSLLMLMVQLHDPTWLMLVRNYHHLWWMWQWWLSSLEMLNVISWSMVNGNKWLMVLSTAELQHASHAPVTCRGPYLQLTIVTSIMITHMMMMNVTSRNS